MLLVSGCATYSPVPENYQGPVSTIASSQKRHSISKADIFYLSRVDGQNIRSSLNATREASYGQGPVLTTKLVSTRVPSREGTFTLVGRTEYAAPIQALTGTVYEVQGDIAFAPRPNETYVVKGQLGPDYSAVWIESRETGEVVQKKIEIHGNTALKIWQK